MPISDSRYHANKAWDNKNTEKITIQYRKSLFVRDRLRAWADAEGISIAAFVLEAIEEKARRDGLEADN